LIKQLLTGTLPTPDGNLQFPGISPEQFDIQYLPLHPVGLQNQNRLNVLRLRGTGQMQYFRQPYFDWELKAAPTPYDGIQELMAEYQLGTLHGDSVTIEAIAFNVAIVDFSSPIIGTKATVKVRLAPALSMEMLTLGYRTISQGKVLARSILPGQRMRWTAGDGYQEGVIEFEIPEAAVLHCVVSYDGIAQHFGWLADRATVQNARRTAYEAFDGKLETIKNIIATAQGRGADARDLESAVAWLLWMLGFSVAHLGGTRRTQEAADLIATTPAGHFAVIECTTGLYQPSNCLTGHCPIACRD
jgi:hypothetical protein